MIPILTFSINPNFECISIDIYDDIHKLLKEYIGREWVCEYCLNKVYMAVGEYDVSEEAYRYSNPIHFAYACGKNDKINRIKRERFIITDYELDLGFAGELEETLVNEAVSDYDILLNKLDYKSDLDMIIADLTAWQDIILINDGFDIFVLMKIGMTTNKKAIDKLKGLIKKYHNGPKYFSNVSFFSEPKCGIAETITSFLERLKDIAEYDNTFN